MLPARKRAGSLSRPGGNGDSEAMTYRHPHSRLIQGHALRPQFEPEVKRAILATLAASGNTVRGSHRPKPSKPDPHLD